MQSLIDILRQSAPFGRVLEKLTNGGEARVEGAWGAAMPFLVAGMALETGRLFLCVTPHVEQAEEFVEDVNVFSPGLASYFPAWEALGDDDLPDADILSQRVSLLRELFGEARPGEGETGARGRVIVAPAQAVLQQVVEPEAIEENTLEVAEGDTLDPDGVARWLAERGFRHAAQVADPGEYSRRGGILDIFPYVSDMPVRIEFFGDEVESIRGFDPDTQASVTSMPHCRVTAVSQQWGARERRAADSIFKHLPRDAWMALVEPAELLARAETLSAELGESAAEAGARDLREAAARFPTLHMAPMPGAFGADAVELDVHSVERFGPSVERVVAELAGLCEQGRRVIVLCNNEAEKARLGEMAEGTRLAGAKNLETRVGHLNRGFDWPGLGFALLPHHELFNRYRLRRTKAKPRHTRAIDSFMEISPGDYVVQVVHGIGRFAGMEVIETKSGQKRECLKIQYAEGSVLYVPANKIELVQKYLGPSEARPRLNKIGGKGWTRQKQKAEAAVRDLAADMLRVAALRESREGIRHPPDTEWQQEFEQSFIYTETEDQLVVAADLKADLEAPRPMDRLVCGDVGYGKTELAMRAAFKAVLGGRQVALLAPTTILAMQHYRTFKERMADYPVVIEMLSRFRTRGEQGRTIARLKEGAVDIVVGTHRLVQEDVAFKDLGLVVVDEEQRFGVGDKERLKHMRETVDVLTMTATPIPRTLHMSLLGLRDISSLQTPPRDRLAIQTRLWRYDPQRIRQAVLRELARDGQVYFVHNRVESIDRVAAEVRATVPEARVLVGHGQMSERELERVMRAFVDHEADVLVCTTIIESGLDIPNVNTILVNEADRFGLSQLHQLRGRVGRYKHRAYAYMLLPRERPLTPVAGKRLKAIEEFADLGAGFRIAMRDLEIRGAGNILGGEQSGHIAAVGYEMYCRLLETAVRRLKHEEEPEKLDVSLAFGVEAFLPPGYVRDPGLRIDLYRRLHRAETEADVDAAAAELADRFGPVPKEARMLLDEARLRIRCEKAKIRSMARDGGSVTLKVESMSRALQALDSLAPRLRPLDEATLYMKLESDAVPPEVVMRFFMRSLAG